MRRLRLAECVIERLANPLLDRLFAVQRHRMAQVKLEQPQIIETKDVVGVLVRETPRVNNADALPQQLLPQIGWRIDEQIALRQTNQRRAARALIARVATDANVTGATDRRHADARSGSE